MKTNTVGQNTVGQNTGRRNTGRRNTGRRNTGGQKAGGQKAGGQKGASVKCSGCFDLELPLALLAEHAETVAVNHSVKPVEHYDVLLICEHGCHKAIVYPRTAGANWCQGMMKKTSANGQ